MQTDPKQVNNLFIFFQALKQKTHKKKELLWLVREENPDRAKNQSDCRISYRARLEKNKLSVLFISIMLFLSLHSVFLYL